MVDPLLTALRIISIFFFSATEKRRRLITTADFDAGEPPA
jgi:hypothetical protein